MTHICAVYKILISTQKIAEDKNEEMEKYIPFMEMKMKKKIGQQYLHVTKQTSKQRPLKGQGISLYDTKGNNPKRGHTLVNIYSQSINSWWIKSERSIATNSQQGNLTPTVITE